jgi:peptide deformylase
MSLRDLHLLGSPALRTRSTEVEAVDEAIRRLIDDLFETMDAAKGVGLAANQVGITTRVAVVEADGHRLTLVNPVLRSPEGKAKSEEGCLSIPDVYADVTRPERIVLEAIDREGQPYVFQAEGLLARAIQHEVDHLDGILFIDHLSPLKRQMLLARYKKDHKGEAIIKPLKGAEAGR